MTVEELQCPCVIHEHHEHFQRSLRTDFFNLALSLKWQFYFVLPNILHSITSVLCNYWHCSHSMRQGLCNGTVSVCLFRLSTAAAACWAPCCQEISIDSGGRQAPSSSGAAARGCSSKCEQCHVDSRRRKLKTRLVHVCLYVGGPVSAAGDSQWSGAHSWLSWHRHARQNAYLFSCPQPPL